jgi:hypothetical protein
VAGQNSMVSFAAPLANAEILQYQCECSGLLVRLRPKQAASWCGRAVEGGGCGAEKDEGVAALNSTTPWVTGRARGERWAAGCSPNAPGAYSFQGRVARSSPPPDDGHREGGNAP